MSITTYTTNAGRINEVKGEILAHAQPVEVLAMGCKMVQMPTRMGDNVSYRRFIPFGATTTSANTINRPVVTAANHITQEGVTPTPDQLTEQDINVVQQRYACVYSYTEKTAILHEDDIPEEMKIQTGERMALVGEKVRFGVMKAITSVQYAGGTTRGTVDEAISINQIRLATRTLKANHAKMKTKILAPSPNYDTYAVEAAYICFVHTDAEADIRDLPGFVPTAKYGNRSVLSPHEIGSCESVRFILSPELSAYADSGASITGTGLYSTTGTSADVYPFIICGEDAVYDVALRGHNSFNVWHIPWNKREKADVGAQRGYVGAEFYQAVVVVNNGWGLVIEAGISALT